MSAISALAAGWFRSVFHASALSANSGQSRNATDAFPIQSVSPLSLLFTPDLAILSALVLTFGVWGGCGPCSTAGGEDSKDRVS
jgi:hypothetical protein